MFASVSDRSGQLHPLQGGGVAFAPNPLPPDLALNPAQWRSVMEAERRLGELKGRLEGTRQPAGLARLAALQEAVASSQLEGREVSLDEALWWQLDGPSADLRSKSAILRLTCRHADQLQSQARLATVPDLKLLHESLYEGVSGHREPPGQLRSSVIWLGPPGSTLLNAPYVPPRPENLPEHLQRLTTFQSKRAQWPSVVHAALIYYQVETLHPFVDGTGRMARSCMLHSLGEHTSVAHLLLRPAVHWAKDRTELFRQLQALREHGVFESWVDVFARSIRSCADEALRLLDDLDRWLQNAAGQIEAHLSGQRGVATQLLDHLVGQAIIDVSTASRLCGRNFANANILIQRLVALNLLQEITGRRRNRRYTSVQLNAILSGPAPDTISREETS